MAKNEALEEEIKAMNAALANMEALYSYLQKRTFKQSRDTYHEFVDVIYKGLWDIGSGMEKVLVESSLGIVADWWHPADKE